MKVLFFTILVSMGFALAANEDPSSFNGFFKDPLTKIDCKSDSQRYGDYFIYFRRLTTQEAVCGKALKQSGFAVYYKNTWYLWGSTISVNKNNACQIASLNNKYKEVKQIFDDAGYGRKKDSLFVEDGYYDAVKYNGQNVEAGYWVYISPYWCIFGQKDLAAAGYLIKEKVVNLQKGPLTLRLEYKKDQDTWANETLDVIARGIQATEEFTGMPYPGANPYPIEERDHLYALGRANADVMMLRNGSKDYWTTFHEIIHIWNASINTVWVTEGHADFIGYLNMKKFKLPFFLDETWEEYLSEWKDTMGTKYDKPITTYEAFYSVGAGKSMAFWSILYELFGPQLINDVFKAALNKPDITPQDLAKIIDKYTDKNPNDLLQGWLTPGNYLVKKTTDFGPVKYPLP